MKRVLVYTILLVLCLIPVMTSDTLADGKYFPAKAYRTSPTIHSQRAILKYKDGVETLVIESSFDGEGKDFGWVIPLPNKPIKFEEASAEFLDKLSDAIQPMILHRFSLKLDAGIFAATIVAVFFVISLIFPHRGLISGLLWLLVFFLFPFILVMSFGASKGLGNASQDRVGVNVVGIEEVGSFGLVVLEADNVQSLDDWLKENDFAGLNKTEQQIISDYIKEDWCFVAAKLKRDGEGYTEPHPLAMIFEVEMPVYPMRLTAAAESEVFLELFVIAENYASSPIATGEVACRYSYNSDVEDGKPGYIGRYFNDDISHPEMNKFMWDKCVITRLCDFLEPDDMKEDIVVKLNDGGDYQRFFMSSEGAFDLALGLGLQAWSVVIIVLSLYFNRKEAKLLRWKGKIIKIFIPATCVMVIITCWIYFPVDKVKVFEPPENTITQIKENSSLSDKEV